VPIEVLLRNSCRDGTLLALQGRRALLVAQFLNPTGEMAGDGGLQVLDAGDQLPEGAAGNDLLLVRSHFLQFQAGNPVQFVDGPLDHYAAMLADDLGISCAQLLHVADAQTLQLGSQPVADTPDLVDLYRGQQTGQAVG